jgi:hypothetical protein
MMTRRRARNTKSAGGEAPTSTTALFMETMVFLTAPISNQWSKREMTKNPGTTISSQD